jgi:hypothetical protein
MYPHMLDAVPPWRPPAPTTTILDRNRALSGPTKSLLFTAVALTAVIIGTATAFLSKADGATVPATVRRRNQVRGQFDAVHGDSHRLHGGVTCIFCPDVFAPPVPKLLGVTDIGHLSC